MPTYKVIIKIVKCLLGNEFIFIQLYQHVLCNSSLINFRIHFYVMRCLEDGNYADVCDSTSQKNDEHGFSNQNLNGMKNMA